MKLQLFRDRLACELRDLPDIRSQEVQSYALTTAVLVRYVIQELGMEDIQVPTPYHPNETSHPLGTILNSIVHYRAFYPLLSNFDRDASECFFYLYSSKDMQKGNRFQIRLHDYFDIVRRIADDDLLIAQYLFRRTIRLLKQSINSHTTLDPEFLQKVTNFTEDALAHGLKLGNDGAIEIPVDVYVDYCEGALRPGTKWDFVYDYSGSMNSADFVLGFGSKWQMIPFRPKKEQVGGVKAFCFGIEKIDHQEKSLPAKICVVPFDGFVKMFEEIHCQCKDMFRAGL